MTRPTEPKRKRFFDFSDRQQAILRFIEKFWRAYGYSPTIREIGDAVNISSTQVVSYNIEQLIRWGYLIKSPRAARSLRVLIASPNRTRRLPRQGNQGPALSIHLELSEGSPQVVMQADAARALIESFLHQLPPAVPEISDISARNP